MRTSLLWSPLLLVLIALMSHNCAAQDKPAVKTSKDEKKDAKPVYIPAVPKEVVVIGGGMAGLAAARTITADRTNFTVRVYEAQKSRFGGRVWTDKLNNPRAKGPEVDLGGTKLSVLSKNNPLIELAEKFELKMTKMEGLKFFIPWEQKSYEGDEVTAITKSAVQILNQALNESRNSDVEVSVKEAVDKVLKDDKFADADSPSAYFVKCLPSYTIRDYTTKNYKPDDLDIGYDKVLLDGMGELVDRLVSGSMDEVPLHLALNKVARQIKVHEDKDKVIVRFRDGSQVLADIVVVAVPVTVVSSGDLLFEPDLPPKYKLAANEITTMKMNKLILEFENVFWPEENGVFLRAVKDEKDIGKMQAWLNMQKVVGRPILISFFIGESAVELEAMSEEEIIESALSVLNEMFGEATVSFGGKIVKVQRSEWVKDEFFKGASTYPGVGTDPKLWDTFAEPLCPFIYFAGEYTASDGRGSLHGAYNSGVRVGNQILSRLCDIRLKEQREREEAERKKKAEMEGKSGVNETGEDEKKEEDLKDEL